MQENPYIAPETSLSDKLPRPPGLLTFCCGFSCVMFAFVSIANGTPSVWAPFPLATVIPALIFYPLILLLPVFVFTAVNRALFQAGSPANTIPRGSVKFAGAVLFLNALWIANGWSYGVTYQGVQHTAAVATINLAFAVLMFLLWRVSRTSASWPWRLALSTVFSIWLFWFAFPWLGELP